jgi:hypothetical protein
MRKLIVMMVIAMLACFGMAAGGWPGDPMSKQEAKPELKERLMKDTTKGTLMRTGGDYYWIKDEDGKETKVHVDMSTKMDKVITGNRVKAYLVITWLILIVVVLILPIYDYRFPVLTQASGVMGAKRSPTTLSRVGTVRIVKSWGVAPSSSSFHVSSAETPAKALDRAL